MAIQSAKPFLKWAGGKTQLLSIISTQIPFNNDQQFIYIEPFVGGGAVLFWILTHYPQIDKAVINDLNIDLISAYKTIKNNVEDLIYILDCWQKEYYQIIENSPQKSDYYYQKRTEFNLRNNDLITQTALLIFLNKTCFNGLYRVNKKNQFNVPIGSYQKPLICDRQNLKLVHQLLQKVEILQGDFAQTIEFAQENSFFYFDPPYKPISSTSSFKAYASKNFNDREQIRLKEFCDRLNELNSKWVLSNSDVKNSDPENNFFDELYQSYRIQRVSAKRNINSQGDKRGQLNELLITNQI